MIILFLSVAHHGPSGHLLRFPHMYFQDLNKHMTLLGFFLGEKYHPLLETGCNKKSHLRAVVEVMMKSSI